MFYKFLINKLCFNVFSGKTPAHLRLCYERITLSCIDFLKVEQPYINFFFMMVMVNSDFPSG